MPQLLLCLCLSFDIGQARAGGEEKCVCNAGSMIDLIVWVDENQWLVERTFAESGPSCELQHKGFNGGTRYTPGPVNIKYTIVVYYVSNKVP